MDGHNAFWDDLVITNKNVYENLKRCKSQVDEVLTLTSMDLFQEVVQVNIDYSKTTQNELLQLLKCIVKITEDPTPVDLVVALGASTEPPLIRTVSYIIVSLDLMNIFYKYWEKNIVKLMPRLKIVDASLLGMIVNYPEQKETVKEMGKQRMDLINCFLKQFFPELQKHVVICNDYEMYYFSIMECEEVFKKIEKNDSDRPVAANLINNMMERNSKRTEKQIMQYVRNHSLLFGDILCSRNSSLYNFGPEIKPWWILSIGGYGERQFNEFRRLFFRYDTNYPLSIAIRLVSPIGYMPPYFAYEFDKAISKENLDYNEYFSTQQLYLKLANRHNESKSIQSQLSHFDQIKKDINYLHSYLGKTQYQAFLNKFSSKIEPVGEFYFIEEFSTIVPFKEQLQETFVKSFEESYKSQKIEVTSKFLIDAFEDAWKALTENQQRWKIITFWINQQVTAILFYQYTSDSSIYVAQLAVHPEWTSIGIGKLLMRKLLQSLKEETQIFGLVKRKNQRAIEFYEKLGAQKVSFTYESYSPDDYQGFGYRKTIQATV